MGRRRRSGGTDRACSRCVVAVTVHARGDLAAGIACAALAPAVFLLTNRVFSPQFALVVLAAWAVAAALLARSARDQLGLGMAAMLATYANAVVIPGFADAFLPWSALFFTVALALTGWLLWSILRRAGPTPVDRPRLQEDRHRAAVHRPGRAGHVRGALEQRNTIASAISPAPRAGRAAARRPPSRAASRSPCWSARPPAASHASVAVGQV